MENFNILIVEDEPIIANKVKLLVEELNWAPLIVENIPDLLNTLSTSKINFEILVLDRMLNGMDSADFVSQLRHQNPTLKIIILSAIDSSLEKARLIEDGADDYLAKPFESSEFKARLKSLVRRSGAPSSDLKYEVANISIDLISRTVSVLGVSLNLTAKEFLVLHSLASSVGKIYSKTQLIESVWGYSLENETNVVESTMNSLRRKLEQAGSTAQIKNTRFAGYWLEV